MTSSLVSLHLFQLLQPHLHSARQLQSFPHQTQQWLPAGTPGAGESSLLALHPCSCCPPHPCTPTHDSPLALGGPCIRSANRTERRCRGSPRHMEEQGESSPFFLAVEDCRSHMRRQRRSHEIEAGCITESPCGGQVPGHPTCILCEQEGNVLSP